MSGEAGEPGPRHCTDCRAPLPAGGSAGETGDEPLCVPCAEVRALAFGSLAARQAGSPAARRRGPRHVVPGALAARVVLQSGGGVLGSSEPVLEISRHGFRIATLRQMDAGQRLECEVCLPDAREAPAHFEVEVRWVRREGAHWEIGVEVDGADVDRFSQLYERQIAALRS